ncbi:hypothetical protein K501DRAFT_290094 [Backusella circina FSU 941]|nr:hypothetical protein K501DRAFT_290094 [Backusella circina FSU 941]
MTFSLYHKSPDTLHELVLIDFFFYSLVDTKFTILLYDSPASYVCRMDHTRTIDSPEEPDDLCNELLPILKAVYQSRLMMKSTSKLVKQKATDNDVNIDQYMSFLSSFTNEVSKRKRRRSSDSAEEKHYCD